ncbi:MAG TPA: universal stress protein [Streptomyces sp.]|uniref:universal stress protein n=1 Tax=Streptomyces sp. TaxID=1931 RepID=UPI002B98A9D3|nr:universal stress protein [Streptomyces sp.]HWU10590.1 universal stress protein [Streptomyces sp.]
MQRPIIVGIDGTSDSLIAAGWAAGEAWRHRTPLVLLHGHVPRERSSHPLLVGHTGHERRAARQLLDDALAWVREHHEDVEVSAELMVQPEAELLVERSRQAQMIVLGSRRPGPVTGFFLRSVGLRVLSRSACPVVMIRGGTASCRSQDGEIVAGVPREEEAGAVLDFAFRAAAARGAPLRAARAWHLPAVLVHEPELLNPSRKGAELEEVQRHDLANQLAPWRERHPQVTVVEHVESGPTSEMLVALAASAQLLVVGRRAGPRSRYVGHVAHATLHFADAPIALVPHASDADH